MAKITWLGEDTDTVAGPSFNVWNGVKFPKGKAVEVNDAHMIAKARGNQFYEVTEGKAEKAPPAKEPDVKTTQAQPAPTEKAAPAQDDYPPVKAKAEPSHPKKKVRRPKATADKHAHR